MKNNNYYAVILAGGSGTRFWPLSRRHKPKQFLKIVGEKTLLELTLERIRSLVPAKNIFIVTNKIYRKDISYHTKKFSIPSSNILYEPQGKNTAPAILWAANLIARRNPNGLMAVLPSDHLIQDKSIFLRIAQKAFHLADKNYLVTLGIVPTRPETGYGYLKTVRQGAILKVEKFTEKPDLKKAKQFIESKNYFWNSGMFFWKTNVVLSAYEKYLPEMYKLIGPAKSNQTILKNWNKLQGVSVDYGILEKANNVLALAADMGWSDVGSWEALAQVLPSNKEKNTLRGEVLTIASHNNLVFGDDKPIATIGVSDLVVIDTPDALLICRKDYSQSVKDVVEVFKKNKKDLV
jgi:mannose-1-phosphate guanylyltransferase